MAQVKVKMYDVKARESFVATDPQVVVLKRGRSKVRMKAYKAKSPLTGITAYKIIGKA